MIEGAKDFFDNVKKEVTRDIDSIATRMAIFTDHQIIGKKFDEGFKKQGHVLTPFTIRKKGGNTKVGTNTGELRKAAVNFLNWKVFRHRLGATQVLYRKQRFGLTEYSHFVRTREGGIIDFLELTSDDKVKLRVQARVLSSQKNFSSSGAIRFIEAK